MCPSGHKYHFSQKFMSIHRIKMGEGRECFGLASKRTILSIIIPSNFELQRSIFYGKTKIFSSRSKFTAVSAASNHQRWASFRKKKKANGRWVVIFRLLFNSLRDWHDDCQAPIFEKVTAYVTSSEIATFNQVTSSMIWIEPQVKSPLKEGGDGYGKRQSSPPSSQKKEI